MPSSYTGRCTPLRMPVLTPTQSAVLVALDWLFNPGVRRVGRTTTIAIANIRAAIRAPGLAIRILDHFGNRDSDRLVSAEICRFLQDDPRLAYRLNDAQATLVVTLTHAIPDWLPIGWSRPSPTATTVLAPPGSSSGRPPGPPRLIDTEREPQLERAVRKTPRTRKARTLWDHLSDDS